jgi:hypothetical protein
MAEKERAKQRKQEEMDRFKKSVETVEKLGEEAEKFLDDLAEELALAGKRY